MSPRTKRRLIQVGSLILAAGLLYLALQGVDLESVGTALRQADYRWLAPLLVVAVTSHILRAWRWQLLLETLPERSEDISSGRVSLGAAFSSVMIGYMVNYAASRLGELARAGNLAARERLSFGGVLGTVAAERVLDVATLAVALASAFLLLLGRFEALNEILAPAYVYLGAVTPGNIALGAAATVAVLGIGWGLVKHFRERLQRTWTKRITPALSTFKEGFMTLLRCPRRPALLLSTVAIWTCYLAMAYLPLLMLGLTSQYGLSLVDTWIIFLMGSLGIVIPAPGGMGSYHYITIESMEHLFSVARSPAATYAVITHAAQLILYTTLGFICLVAQGTSFRALRHRSLKAREASDSA